MKDALMYVLCSDVIVIKEKKEENVIFIATERQKSSIEMVAI